MGSLEAICRGKGTKASEVGVRDKPLVVASISIRMRSKGGVVLRRLHVGEGENAHSTTGTDSL